MEKAAEQPAPSVVNLFCGVGGLAYWFVKAGLRVAAGIGTGESHKHAFEASARSRSACRSVEDVSPRELARHYGGRGRRALIGCSLCRPFSGYNRSRVADPERSPPNVFMRIVRGTCPRGASLENVPSLRPHAVLKKFGGCLGGEGRAPAAARQGAPAAAPPRIRRRLALPASGTGNIGMINETRGGRPPAVRGATGDLEPMRAGCLSAGDPHRGLRGLSAAKPVRRLQARPGGGRLDWEMRSVLPHNGKRPGKPRGGAYDRMPRNRFPPTLAVRAAARGIWRFDHPEQDGGPPLGAAAPIRALSRGRGFAGEKPRMQSGEAARHMESAVPAAIERAIAPSTKLHLVDHDGRV